MPKYRLLARSIVDDALYEAGHVFTTTLEKAPHWELVDEAADAARAMAQDKADIAQDKADDAQARADEKPSAAMQAKADAAQDKADDAKSDLADLHADHSDPA
jgi:hypothetical protein